MSLQSGFTVGFKRLHSGHSVLKAGKYEFILAYAFVRNCAQQRRPHLWEPCTCSACAQLVFFAATCNKFQIFVGKAWTMSQTNQTAGWENTGIPKLVDAKDPRRKPNISRNSSAYIATRESRTIIKMKRISQLVVSLSSVSTLLLRNLYALQCCNGTTSTVH